MSCVGMTRAFFLLLLLAGPVLAQQGGWFMGPKPAHEMLRDFPGDSPAEGRRIIEALFPGLQCRYDYDRGGFVVTGPGAQLDEFRFLFLEGRSATDRIALDTKALTLKPGHPDFEPRPEDLRWKRARVTEYYRGRAIKSYPARCQIWIRSFNGKSL